MRYVFKSGLDIPVIAPVQALEEYVTRTSGTAPEIVGVWADMHVIASGTYSSVFKGDKDGSSGCICFSPEKDKSLKENLYNFLDAYIASGSGTPLQVIMIDDPLYAPNADLLNNVADEIMSSETHEDMPYRKVLADGFRFVDVLTAIRSACYMALRENNAFTHRISDPAVKIYLTVPSGEMSAYSDGNGSFTDSFKFNRAPDSMLETTRTVEWDRRYVPDTMVRFMSQNAPSTYSGFICL